MFSKLFRQSGVTVRARTYRLQRSGLVHAHTQNSLFSTAAKKENLAVLCILDGWGYNESTKMNAVLLGNTPNFDKLYGHHSQQAQQAFLYACERHVGLPMGQIGNSEVGHMNIGAGRVVWQDICTIDNAIEDKSLASQSALVNHINALKKSGGTCHLMGLVSPGGVHAMDSHIAELANAVNKEGVPVVIHAFTDGRDVPPQNAIDTFPAFLAKLDSGIKVATVTGRYYAMDRDNRWERVGKAYDVIVNAKGEVPGVPDAVAAIKQSYSSKVNDEFILPTVIGDYSGMKDGDGVLMANFRADRAREILYALVDPNPPEELGLGKDRPKRPTVANAAGMVQYSDRTKAYMEAIFPVKDIQKSLGEVVANNGLKQLRIAETEKYPHVTFFFNGGRETTFEGEDRIMVPSPKVATYDLQPEMSAPEVGQKVCGAIDTGKYNLVVLNFANPDMVGHTGDLSAAIKAVESVDVCLGNLVNSVKAQKGVLIVTADHGNCEQMWDETTNGPHTAHTLNKVPVIIADYSGENRQLRIRDGGALCDLAPTILDVLGVAQPAEMTGKSLITQK